MGPGVSISIHSGGGGAAYVPWLAEANCLCALRGDLGITIGTGVSAWADQSGNANDFVQATADNQPAFNATGGPGSTPIVTGDGANDVLYSAGFNMAAPGTTSGLIYLVMNQVTWTSAERITSSGASASQYMIYQSATTPRLRGFNGANSTENAGAPVGQWKRVAVFYNNATTDFIRCGAENQTGVAMGNAAATGRSLFAGYSAGVTPTMWSNVELAQVLVFAGYTAVTVEALMTRLDADASARWGASVLT